MLTRKRVNLAELVTNRKHPSENPDERPVLHQLLGVKRRCHTAIAPTIGGMLADNAEGRVRIPTSGFFSLRPQSRQRYLERATMRNKSRVLGLFGLLLIVLEAQTAQGQTKCFTAKDFPTLEKIDCHFHLHSDDARFLELAAKDKFSIVNIATQSAPAEVMREKHRTVFAQLNAHPNRVAAVSSFSMDGWDDSAWQKQTIEFLDSTFEKGAVGVKVWKNIGMVFRDQAGSLVMIDDPQLDPIFDHLEKRGIVLMGHLGEPKNCWLPLEEMTVNNDRSYFRRNPQYHMHLHPDMPSYEEQIAARDRMLDKHKNLPFLAAHLASLEWSVDRLGEFLDRYPNAVAGTAARIGQLQYQSQQNREKVIEFMTKYQDRILYGSDSGVGPTHSIPERYQSIRERWVRDWLYFTTEEMIQVPELDDPVKGLGLPKEVVIKLYQTNARRLFASSWGQKARR